ncbi:MAG: 2-iminoacetate synthase ThiH [Denitrovibrio sp.]|nr:MAG: 2-iminoacetate synthase ThiH [Denitrovibrio sp.]
MFQNLLDTYKLKEVQDFIHSRSEKDVELALGASKMTEEDFAALLSPAAEKFVEPMAEEAHRITKQRFGNTIKIYAPLYLSNECTNSCVYCGFNTHNQIPRVTLTKEEIIQEAQHIAGLGIKHLLLVTGESPKQVGIDYMVEALELINKHFSSMAIEVFPMSTEEYKIMYDNGVDGLTLYQETYCREKYAEVHPAGKKRDFDWRLHGPERGAEAGFRFVGVGSLMGLKDFRTEQFFTGLHASYLIKNYWKTHITISFPRIRKAEGNFKPYEIISDTNLVQSMLAHRMFQSDVGLVISTREPAQMRENLLPLGVTQMSAGSKTEPGGYSKEHDGKQFEVEDKRSVEEFCNMIRSKGYDPVMKDWDRSFLLGA